MYNDHSLFYSMDGQLEFYDTDSSDFTLMASPEHSMATDLEWDPTGRYVVTSVSYWSQKVCKHVYHKWGKFCWAKLA